MFDAANPFLLAGAALSAVAALLHLVCIAWGAPAYRLMGAGERMAELVARGHWFPTVVTLGVAAVLTVWSLYALSGAGVMVRLPLLRWGLCAITAVYLLRAVGFPLLIAHIPGNSMAFWVWSSVVCFVIGAVHLVGLYQVWHRL